jgi:hypothetical protein
VKQVNECVVEIIGYCFDIKGFVMALLDVKRIYANKVRPYPL